MLTSLANVKAWLGIEPDYTDSDAMLNGLIASVSAWIENDCDRVFAQQQHVYVFSGNGTASKLLPQSPIVSVQAVNGDVVDVLIADGQIHLKSGVFDRGSYNHEVVYTAGYHPIPADLQQAACEMVALRYKQKDHVGVSSKHIGDETVSFNQSASTPAIKAVLDSYRRVWA